jgi:recombination protein RecA
MAKAGNKATKEKEVVDPRLDAIKKVILTGNKLFGGENVLFRGGDASSMQVEAVSTGSLSLDNAIGCGGLPKGRIIEISGPEASGKTLVSLSTIAECQRNGGVAAFIDVEHALTPTWAKSIGVDWDNLILSQPDSGERALSIMKFLIESGNVDVIVLDSVASLVTKKEIEGDMDANHMALTARLMSLALKKLTPIVAKSKTCCIFINQIRENVGVMYGNKETTPGGKALKFYSSVRLKAWKKSQGAIKKGDEQIGHRMCLQVIKNKVAAPFRNAEFDIYYNSGIDRKSEISELAIAKGVVDRPNARTYVFGDLKWTSREDFDTAIKNDEALAKDLMEKVREALGKKVDDVEESNIIEQDGKIIDKRTGEIIEEVVSEKDLDDEFAA